MRIPAVATHILAACAVALVPGATAAWSPAAAQQQPAGDAGAGPGPAQVMVLGVFHFANPGLDVVRDSVPDVLEPSRQAEIRLVVEALAAFRPTRIAVEQLPQAAARLDSAYTAFRAGHRDLGRSEVQQLGFRLAARFQHPRVYPVDHPGEFPFDAVVAYAAQHDPAFLGSLQQRIAEISEARRRAFAGHSIGAILRQANEPAQIRDDHGAYMHFARVGAGDSYVGADLLAKWYDRNIRIFSNVQGIAEDGERILVIVGSGHSAILRELIEYDPRMSLVEANDYLPPFQE
jgi:hypothetical protein